MTAPNLTRITAQAAAQDKEPLFAAPAAETKFTVSVQMEGFPVTVEFTGNSKKLKAVLAGLKSAGATPPPVKSFGGGFGKRDDTVEPAYDASGKEICPIHGKHVREYKTRDGRTFKGCPSPSTGAAGEKINERGYCSLRFK
jgi:hypothetical protein